MSRNFNPSVRKISRLALEIPPSAILPECNWPKSPKNCTIGERRKLVTSQTLEEKERYQVRSISSYEELASVKTENPECAIGPEYHGLFNDSGDIRTLAEALADLEEKVGGITSKEERQRIIKDVEQSIKMDIGRRSQILLTNAVYFIIAMYLLIYNHQNGSITTSLPVIDNKFMFMLINVIPLLTSFYLHQIYGDRVRSGAIFHLIPLSILISYVIYTRMIVEGGVKDLTKTFYSISLVGGAAVTFFLIYKLRTTYEICSKHQLGSKLNSSLYVTLAIVGILIPLTILLFSIFNSSPAI